MDIKEIQAYLDENKDSSEVKTFLLTFNKPDLPTLKTFVTTDPDAKSWFNSQMDSAVSKGVNTWQTNNLKKLVDDEVGKRGTETETMKMIRELREDNDRRDKEYKKEKLLNKALSYASEKKLPIKFIDKFVADDEPTTIANLEAFNNEVEEHLKKMVDARFADGGREIDTNINQNQRHAQGSLTYEDIKGMSDADLVKNAEAIKKYNEQVINSRR